MAVKVGSLLVLGIDDHSEYGGFRSAGPLTNEPRQSPVIVGLTGCSHGLKTRNRSTSVNDQDRCSSLNAANKGTLVRPSAFAVLRLTRIFVGCSTGMSPGFAPRRILRD